MGNWEWRMLACTAITLSDRCENNLPGGAKAIAVYDAASSCITLIYKQN